MAHPTVLVAHGSFGADVDIEVAPVVLETWRAGIETASSCQDEGESLLAMADGFPWLRRPGEALRGRAYVDFPDEEEMLLFLDAVANGGPRDDLYARIGSPAVEGAWEVRTTVFDTLPTIGTGDWSAPSAFGVGVARVRFPRTDAATIAARLARWNTGEPGPFGPPASP